MIVHNYNDTNSKCKKMKSNIIADSDLYNWRQLSVDSVNIVEWEVIVLN